MIEYLPLKRITAMHADEIHEAVNRVIDGGWYLRGEATERFEAEYAHFIGTKYCVGVANGLDALTLILRAYIYNNVLQEGDEVIVPANTYIASILSITENRLKPVLVEPRLDTLQIDDSLIEQAITPRTRAIMIVHLYGRCAYTERIAAICQAHNLLLIEDNAQAHGCTAHSSQFMVHSSCAQPNYELYTKNCELKKTGSLGHAAAHSFYPGKNLGALGDAGAVTTDDDQLAATVRSIANYGSTRKYVFDYIGRNSRIDELQAAILSVKLKYLDEDNAHRRTIAAYYASCINHPAITIPGASGLSFLNILFTSQNVFHIFPVLCEQRDALQAYLAEQGVQTMIHYPIPPHKQACYADWHNLCLPVTERIHDQELSIPCHQAMTDAEVERVAEIINNFNT
ncbi:MAG: DegT/DnrJ/EryC1/StrS family aminotransferase [Prevotella sp.]|nr:DegT/DnrJ/EryC1/StrS family aminotransferase [Prevotella sp.]